MFAYWKFLLIFQFCVRFFSSFLLFLVAFSVRVIFVHHLPTYINFGMVYTMMVYMFQARHSFPPFRFSCHVTIWMERQFVLFVTVPFGASRLCTYTHYICCLFFFFHMFVSFCPIAFFVCLAHFANVSTYICSLVFVHIAELWLMCCSDIWLLLIIISLSILRQFFLFCSVCCCLPMSIGFAVAAISIIYFGRATIALRILQGTIYWRSFERASMHEFI